MAHSSYSTIAPESPHEELEEIPWGMLGSELGGGRRRIGGVVVLAVVAVVVAAIVGFTVLRRPVEIIEIAPAETSAAVALPGAPGVSPSGAGEPTSVAGPPQQQDEGTGGSSASPPPVAPVSSLYSEADLMAVLPEQELRSAAAAAEWFVAAYFTLDGATGADLPLPPGMPQPERSDAEGAAWVERTHAIAVDAVEQGRYDVTVAFQIMATGPSRGYLRLPLRAVTVPVAMQPDGTVAIADLPSPAATPAVVAMTPPPLLEETVAPEKVAEEAIRQVTWPGAEVEIAATHRTAEGWRVTLRIDDGAGNLIPLVVDTGG